MQLLKWGQKKSRNYPCPLGRSLLVSPTSLPMRPHFRPSALPYLSLPHLFQSIAIIRSRNMQVEYRATLYSSQLLLSVSNLTFQTTPSPSPPPLSHRLIIIIHHPPTHPSITLHVLPSLPPPLTPYRLRRRHRGPIRLYFPPFSFLFFLKRNPERNVPE